MDSIRGRGMANINKALQLAKLSNDSNQTNAALSITKHLFLKEEYQNKNIVFSPLSLHVVLSMVAAGSDGPTLDQFLTFHRAESIDQLNSYASKLASDVLRDATSAGGPILGFANGVWVEQSLPLIPSFKQLVATDYNAIFASVDFKNKADEVVNEVNLWAEEKTNGLIKDLLPLGSAESLTRFILANALYFKGGWEEEFDALRTRDRDFYLLNGTPIKVPFMTSKEDQFICVFKGFKVLRLPYRQGDDFRHFSMYIFLPNFNGLSTLVDKLASESEFVECHLPLQKVKVGDFKIPKFKISFQLDISNAVKEMGLVLPFSDNANFTKIVAPGSALCISNIIHKSFIEVNEKGTEAAAAVAMMMSGCALTYSKPKVINFVADHPFLFVIREDVTRTIFFTGQVLHPLHG